MAINREVLSCVSNSALITSDGTFGMLKMWVDGVQRAGVKNFFVIAIDDQVHCLWIEPTFFPALFPYTPYSRISSASGHAHGLGFIRAGGSDYEEDGCRLLACGSSSHCRQG
jgi:hypothetical protein